MTYTVFSRSDTPRMFGLFLSFKQLLVCGRIKHLSPKPLEVLWGILIVWLEEGSDLLRNLLLLVFEIPNQDEGLPRLEIGRNFALHDQPSLVELAAGYSPRRPRNPGTSGKPVR